VIAQAFQGGLSLPERDYYLRDDAKSVELRKQFVAHVKTMMELLGHPAEKAEAEANAILTIETSLAKGSLDRVSLRDPNKRYNKLSVKDFAALTPSLQFDEVRGGHGRAGSGIAERGDSGLLQSAWRRPSMTRAWMT